MSAAFDGRHRWGDPIQAGARIQRTCRVCGRTDSYETLIPNEVVLHLLTNLNYQNPYRRLVGLQRPPS